MSAFDLLADIEQQILQNAAEIPASQGSGFWQAVAFELAETGLLMRMEYVREVLSLPTCTRLPGVKSWMLGIANVRGQILPIMDLGAYMELMPSKNRASRRVLVVQKGDIEMGILVDRVIGMRQVADQSVKVGDNSALLETLRPYCSGKADMEGETFAIFELDRLLDNHRFQQIATG